MSYYNHYFSTPRTFWGKNIKTKFKQLNVQAIPPFTASSYYSYKLQSFVVLHC